MFFTTGSEASEEPEDVASSRNERDSTKEPEKKVFAPNEDSGDADGDYAEPEIFRGEHRPLVPAHDPKECLAECSVRRDRSRKKKVAG